MIIMIVHLLQRRVIAEMRFMRRATLMTILSRRVS